MKEIATSNALKSEAIQFAMWKHERMMSGDLNLLAAPDKNNLWFYNFKPGSPVGSQDNRAVSWEDLYEQFKKETIES